MTVTCSSLVKKERLLTIEQPLLFVLLPVYANGADIATAVAIVDLADDAGASMAASHVVSAASSAVPIIVASTSAASTTALK